jgi:hypothetical protein
MARHKHAVPAQIGEADKVNGKRTHGMSRTKLYSVWLSMKNRCVNSNDKSYKNYGGKGVIVCKSWRDDYQAFFDWSMENGYREGLSIDRINTDGNYEPSNCRWTDRLTQNTNTRLIHSTNKSGYRGVSFYATYQRWRASIQVCKKTHFIGYFDDATAAALARDAYVISNNLPHPLNFEVAYE